MSIKDLFVIKEAGPFTVIPGGKPAGEPADPQGILYPADKDQTPKGQLLASIEYVIQNLREAKTKITEADESELYKIVLDLTDTASDLNWALKKILDEE